MLIKKGALKNFTNYTGKTPMLESPLNKTASPQACSFIKKRLQHWCPLENPQNLQEHPSFKNIPPPTTDGSFWRKAKYDFSSKVREQSLYSRVKTGAITLN